MPIPELDIHLTEYMHRKTKASVLYIKANDPENVFCLSFKTIPKTSNGVAHILEHTVLCGSKRYPVKDPFFSMTRRSLNTFMNALTGSDFTCYPAATLVKKDFYNLLDVYLDAVFYPNLTKESFLQEGHRLEFQDIKNKDSPIEFKGIVYNEMKGALSSPQSRLNEAVNSLLFPSITYGINSGGDPKEIPNLTHKELIAFHKEHYHPSRCLFFFYGDMPIEGHLDFIDKKVLSKTKPKPPLPLIHKQSRFKKMKSELVKYPLSKEEITEKKGYLSFGWLTEPISNQEELLGLAILQVMLMDTDASPLKMAILKSGLATSASISFDSEIAEASAILTLSGLNEKDAGSLEKVVFSTLKSIYKQGIDKKLIESALHQFEFHRSEINGDSYPFGLILFFKSGLLMQHGVPPEKGLVIHSLIQKLEERLRKSPRYFEDLLKKYMLDNPHLVKVVMAPDPSLAKKEAEEERKKLNLIAKKMTAKEKSDLIVQTKKLEKSQKQQETQNINILPKLTLKDIPQKIRDYPLKKTTFDGLNGFTHSCFTNHILYADLVYPLPHLKKEDLYLFRVFSTLLPQIGVKGMGYEKLLAEIQAHTGGIGASVSLHLNAHDFKGFAPTLHLSGKCLTKKIGKMIPLMKKIALSADFKKKERIKEVLLKHWTSLDARVVQNALRYAMSLSTKSLSESQEIQDSWVGLGYWQSMRQLSQAWDASIDHLIERFLQLQEQIFEKCTPDLVISGDDAGLDILRKEDFSDFVKTKKKMEKWPVSKNREQIPSQGRLITSSVAFSSLALSHVPYDDPQSPHFSLAANLLDNCYLHQKIREEGGAYGGGVSNHPLSGNFVFFAYRDPHIVSTKKAFFEGTKEIAKGRFTKQDLVEAKLEAIQAQDSPVSPGNRADIAYGWHLEKRTPEDRQKWRERLIKTTKEEVMDALNTRILPKMQDAPFVAFAGKEVFEKENALLIDGGEIPLPLKPLF